jgi:hypothetical protein
LSYEVSLRGEGEAFQIYKVAKDFECFDVHLAFRYGFPELVFLVNPVIIIHFILSKNICIIKLPLVPPLQFPGRPGSWIALVRPCVEGKVGLVLA